MEQNKISEIRVEEVEYTEENEHFWRVYYTLNDKIIILGTSVIKPELVRVKAIYKWSIIFHRQS